MPIHGRARLSVALFLLLASSAAHDVAAAGGRPRTVAGQLEVLVEDRPGAKRPRYTYFLKLRSGKLLTLDFRHNEVVPRAAGLHGKGWSHLGGTRLKVYGMLHRSRLVVSRVRAPRALRITTRAVTPGPKKVAVILFNFQDASPLYTVDFVRNTIFLDSNSPNAFYKEESGNLIALTGKLRADGDVFGYYTIPYNTPPTGTCSGAAITPYYQAADAAAQADGVDLSGYDYYMYVYSQAPGVCGTAFAFMPGNRSFHSFLVPSVVAHELGHNFNLGHAGSYACVDSANQPVPMSDNCTPNDSGDPFDLMGTGYRHNHGYFKTHLGFLPLTNTRTVNVDGIYTLAPSEQELATTQVLRIPRATGPVADYYYVDFRQPFGTFDNFSPTDAVVNGVGIRIAPEYGVVGASPKLLDMNPQTTGRGDAPLAVGNTFTDPAIGVAITTLSVGPSGATVQIDVPAPPETIVEVVGGTLTYAAANGEANNVTISLGATTYTVEDTAVTLQAGPGCQTTSNVHKVTCDAAPITAILADAGTGNDTVVVNAPTPSVIKGGTGNDVLRGSTGNDSLSGGSGNDLVDGRGGDDMLLGNFGADTLTGGNGYDTVDYSAATAAVTVSIDNVANDGNADDLDSSTGLRDDVRLDVENVVGSSFNDTLVGSGDADRLDGGPGNDSLTGGGGNDTLVGGPGSDSFNAGGGADVVEARDTVPSESIVCGTGADSATTDFGDLPNGDCETVTPG